MDTETTECELYKYNKDALFNLTNAITDINMNPYRSVPEENIVDNPSIDHFKNKFIKKKKNKYYKFVDRKL